MFAAGSGGIQEGKVGMLSVRRNGATAIDEGCPVGPNEATGSVDKRCGPVAGLEFSHLCHKRQSGEVRVNVATVKGTYVFHPDTIDCVDLRDHEVDQPGVGKANHQLVDHVSGAGLENLNPEQVTSHRSDPARHLSEGTGTIGKPESQHDGMHRPNPTAPLLPQRHDRARAVNPSA